MKITAMLMASAGHTRMDAITQGVEMVGLAEDGKEKLSSMILLTKEQPVDNNETEEVNNVSYGSIQKCSSK